MAYVNQLQPDAMKVGPPPYPAQDMIYGGMQPQYQVPPPGQPAYYNAGPPPMPVYAQPAPVGRVIGGAVGSNPQGMQCPSCHQQIITNVQYEVGGGTWLIAALICFFGGFLGCCFIPFCVPACQDSVHTCPSCQMHLGRRSVL